jgi:response regulator RpfG family c-di-GMP phosphodiesterase
MMSPDLTGVHVLLIEDEDDVRHLLGQHLDDLGCRVTDARTGEDGIERALADASLSKPFRRDTLARTLQAATGR